MIRKDKFGRPIYSDHLWSKIQKTGKKLVKLGFKETREPNLFVKSISYDSDYKKGGLFADLRGMKYCPIWKDPRPWIYSPDLPFNVKMGEIILLVRAGCNPKITDHLYDEEPIVWWLFCDREGTPEIPSGLCHRCGKDIILIIDWNILNENLYELKEGCIPRIELNYCNTCKEIEYSIEKFHLAHENKAKLCELCGTNEATLKHHITYNPEVKIEICLSCHGKIHMFGNNFPNPLWREKKGETQV